jgi:hypothetical protein
LIIDFIGKQVGFLGENFLSFFIFFFYKKMKYLKKRSGEEKNLSMANIDLNENEEDYKDYGIENK